MPVPREEMETVISQPWDEYKTIIISTTDPAEMRRLVGLGLKPHRISYADEKCTEPMSWTFHAPGDWTVTCRPKKQVSEETRIARAETMRKVQAEKRKGDGE